ncbi:hypothetical protein WMF31_38725 [Sorangium sp. So ce1036]|uniref:hypothetical protein n=1 Tax=Sorangium sp. So ce1036 TaxID=3133328 RepID=UPI003F05E866
MSSEPDRDPKEDLKQGLSLLWRAARKTAGELRRDLDRTSVGKVIDDAGRELVRATTNVMSRLGAELSKGSAPAPRSGLTPEEREARGEGLTGREDPGGDGPAGSEDHAGREGHDGAPPPAGPAAGEPGLRIAVDPPDDDDKPR